MRVNSHCMDVAALELFISIPSRKENSKRESPSLGDNDENSQITTLTVVRAALGIESGDKIEFIQVGEGFF